MKYILTGYCDITDMSVWSEAELRGLYTINCCSSSFLESFPHFNLWIEEICGKNGTFVKVYSAE